VFQFCTIIKNKHVGKHGL